MKKENITQTKVAKKIGITQSYFSKIINGRCRPHYQTAKRLEKALGIPLIVWMEGTAKEIQKALDDQPSPKQEVVA